MSSAGAFDPAIATRRSLRDLAALMALPAMWVDHEPGDIASGLLGVLFGVLHLDYAYVRFSRPGSESTLERTRPEGMPIPKELEHAYFGAVGNREAVTIEVADPASNATMLATVLSSGIPGEDGLVIVGAYREDFPTDHELYLLRVAVGQAAISIHTARHIEDERNARLAAEQALAERNELLDAISTELAGSLAVLSESARRARALADKRLEPTTAANGVPSDAARPPVAARDMTTSLHLTRREAEVLGLVAQGLSNKEIAALMWLSDRTVERHITGLYRKIGVERRSEATAFAMLHGLVSAPERKA